MITKIDKALRINVNSLVTIEVIVNIEPKTLSYVTLNGVDYRRERDWDHHNNRYITEYVELTNYSIVYMDSKLYTILESTPVHRVTLNTVKVLVLFQFQGGVQVEHLLYHHQEELHDPVKAITEEEGYKLANDFLDELLPQSTLLG